MRAMASNETMQAIWRASRLTSSRHAHATCLACYSRPKQSQAIATRVGPQSPPRRGIHSISRRREAPRGINTLVRPQKPGQEIAVLGGGLTGLTTAYYLARFYPSAKITLYESNDRLGGWVDTETIQVRHEGRDETVSFERGPRTVAAQSSTPKWDDFILWELITDLKLGYELYAMNKNPGDMMRRYIYYPDHLADVTAPVTDPSDLKGMLSSWLSLANTVLTEPLFEGAIPSGLKYLATPPDYKLPGHNPDAIRDYSIGEWFTRKLGRPDMVNNLLSAMVHGIYGGDVWKLSMESSIFRRLLLRDQVELKNVPGATMFAERTDLHLAIDVNARCSQAYEIARESAKWGFIGFYNGFSTLTDALEDALRQNPNVTIRTGEPVTSVRFNKQSQNVEIQTEKVKEPKQYSRVISTLFSGTLGKLTGDVLPTLKKQKAVTIQVVNLWYPIPGLNLPHTGFGYLIPGTVPAANNPHAALGVLFDSDREFVRGPPSQYVQGRGRIDTMQGTKFTVMLGGHHWDWLPPDQWPDAKEAAKMAQDTITRQLGIPEYLQEGVVASTKVCRECIPQHYVNHTATMRFAHEELLSGFRGKLTVAGGSYTPPGVLPGLRAGRDVAMHVAGESYIHTPSADTRPLHHVGETGLGWTDQPLDLAPMKRGEVPFRYGNKTS